ncbi:hypothetical protein [Melittangium boletus]|uniref:hypothetical protein n=1 Tax=Melittangium boletus TaxID=83453 RepID=UPI003DA21275
MDFVASELRQLRAFAKRRLVGPRGPGLMDFLDGARWEDVAWDRPLVPEPLSLGFHTPWWALYDEEQRLALNHWIYMLMYYRISDGERFVVASNRAVADFLDGVDADVAGLLRLEADEEEDHIAAFERVRAVLTRRHGVEGLRMPVKPLRPYLVSRRTLRFLCERFGADFVASYYLGRGIVNHLGKAFETQVETVDAGASALARLSHLHTVDENRHMAVSRMMAACTHGLVERRKHTSALYEALHHGLQHVMVRYTLSDSLTKRQERAMSLHVLPRMRALRHVPPEQLEATIDAHFTGLNGLERVRNTFMPRFNQRILERACLAPEDKRDWFELITSLQGNLRYFPAHYVPGLGPAERLLPDPEA